jgi:replicative DNA helicase
MNATQIEIDSQASEMMVVGSMLTSPYAFEFAAKNLLASHFHSQANMFIFTTLQLMHEDGRPADVHLLSQDLKSKNLLDRVGGISYLIQAAQFAGTSAYIEEYVQELKNFACKRRVAELLQIANSTANSEMSSILKEMQEEIGGLQRSIGSPLRTAVPADQFFPVN